MPVATHQLEHNILYFINYTMGAAAGAHRYLENNIKYSSDQHWTDKFGRLVRHEIRTIIQ